MATITVTRCAGGGHVHLTVTESWGTHVIHGTAAELIAAARTRGDRDLLEDVKTVIRNSGASTPAQIKSAIEAATFTGTDNVPEARDL